MLDLEAVGEIEELKEPAAPVVPGYELQTIRASHHAIARLDAKGLTAIEISAQTGVAPSRIAGLRTDTSYRALVAHYGRDAAQVAEMIEAKFQLIAEDTAQLIHERVLDKGDEMSLEEAVGVFKTFADRAGFAPVQRTLNKNVNLNIGARLDAARARKREEIDG